MALLGPEALHGISLSVSVSESPDLGRLGLLEEHLRLALGEIARAVLVAGGELTYGGYIDPEGYGAFLASELQRFGRRDRPFHAVLALSEHRRLAVHDLKAFEENLGLYGDLACLDANGKKLERPYEGRSVEAAPLSEEEIKNSLSAMRREITNLTGGRILVGGEKSGSLGDLPGVVEEFLLSVEAGQPVYLAGGFGGATGDIAVETVLRRESWIPPTANSEEYLPALEAVRNTPYKKVARSLDNGLTDEEKRHLAVTHRASEIAALLSLGMGRRLASRV